MIAHSKPSLDRKDYSSLEKIILNGNIAGGINVLEFEQEMTKFTGRKYASAINSGTSSLHLALLALEVKSGDKVAIPSYSCTALLNVVNYVGASPVFIEINPKTMNMDYTDLKKKLTSRLKAIILPHMFGLPADINSILTLNIPVIEDTAQSIGGEYKNKMVGSFGIISICSFYATKVITTGEGGMILTDSKKIINKINELKEYDNRKKYRLSFNYKMTDIQAAMGKNQLKKISSLIRQRRAIAKTYDKSFMNLKEIDLPYSNSDSKHIYYRYVIQIKKNVKKSIHEFEKNGICCMRPVFLPIHKYFDNKSLPVTDQVWNASISIPIYPSLKNDDIEKIIKTVTKLLDG